MTKLLICSGISEWTCIFLFVCSLQFSFASMKYVYICRNWLDASNSGFSLVFVWIWQKGTYCSSQLLVFHSCWEMLLSIWIWKNISMNLVLNFCTIVAGNARHACFKFKPSHHISTWHILACRLGQWLTTSIIAYYLPFTSWYNLILGFQCWVDGSFSVPDN